MRLSNALEGLCGMLYKALYQGLLGTMRLYKALPGSIALGSPPIRLERKGKERKRKERKGKQRKGKERKRSKNRRGKQF